MTGRREDMEKKTGQMAAAALAASVAITGACAALALTKPVPERYVIALKNGNYRNAVSYTAGPSIPDEMGLAGLERELAEYPSGDAMYRFAGSFAQAEGLSIRKTGERSGNGTKIYGYRISMKDATGVMAEARISAISAVNRDMQKERLDPGSDEYARKAGESFYGELERRSVKLLSERKTVSADYEFTVRDGRITSIVRR